MIFVSASASWAPLWTHLNVTPSARRSLIARAWSCVLYSWHCGGAVRVTKSYSDLQSVMAIAGSSLKVAVANVSGSFFKVSVGFFQLVWGSRIQLQNKRNQESWSSVVFNDVVSADNVLVTTRCIFLQPQLIGFTTQTWFLPMFSCVVLIIVPVWDSGCLFDAKDASENARKRILSMGIGWILIEVYLCLLASCKVLFACMRVSNVALLISLCKKLNRLAKSGLVFTDAYWRDP